MSATQDTQEPSRFVVSCRSQKHSAGDVKALIATLGRQPVGEAVQIVDLLLNTAQTVQVAADGSVWEFFASRHIFHVEDRYADPCSQPRRVEATGQA